MPSFSTPASRCFCRWTILPQLFQLAVISPTSYTPPIPNTFQYFNYSSVSIHFVIESEMEYFGLNFWIIKSWSSGWIHFILDLDISFRSTFKCHTHLLICAIFIRTMKAMLILKLVNPPICKNNLEKIAGACQTRCSAICLVGIWSTEGRLDPWRGGPGILSQD